MVREPLVHSRRLSHRAGRQKAVTAVEAMRSGYGFWIEALFSHLSQPYVYSCGIKTGLERVCYARLSHCSCTSRKHRSRPRASATRQQRHRRYRLLLYVCFREKGQDCFTLTGSGALARSSILRLWKSRHASAEEAQLQGTPQIAWRCRRGLRQKLLCCKLQPTETRF